MRGEDDVFHLEKRVLRIRRLFLQNIQTCPREETLFEGLEEGP
jgi:hypothetical protein